MGKLSVFKVMKTVDEKGESKFCMIESLSTKHSRVSKLNWRYWILILLHIIREHFIVDRCTKEGRNK